MAKNPFLRNDEVASTIAAFINKHASNPDRIYIETEFNVSAIFDVNVPGESIVWLPNYESTFHGTAMVAVHDEASKVLSESKVTFNGKACFDEDQQGDLLLTKIFFYQFNIQL